MRLRKDLMRLPSNRIKARRLKWRRLKSLSFINILLWVVSVILFIFAGENTNSLTFVISSVMGSCAGVLSLMLLISVFNKYKICQINVVSKEMDRDEGSPIYYILGSNNKHIIVESLDVYNQIDSPSTIVAWCYAGKVCELYRGV